MVDKSLALRSLAPEVHFHALSVRLMIKKSKYYTLFFTLIRIVSILILVERISSPVVQISRDRLN